jgi:hypothetical protein
MMQYVTCNKFSLFASGLKALKKARKREMSLLNIKKISMFLE